MPFTPFHLGFGVLVYALFSFLDPIALLLGTVIIDLEPVFYLLFGVGQLHGVLHSFLGVIVFTAPLTLISWCVNKLLLRFFRLDLHFRWHFSLLSGFLGLVSHILFDAGLYPEMMLLYPFSKRTGYLFGYWDNRLAMILLSVMFLLGVIILAVKFLIKKISKQSAAAVSPVPNESDSVE
ncbi:MAG: hypothetical protein K9W42_04080 [Candidatus Heimdallarchaeota archaeon]|nr:hypothetical protein [Candidatus Heimdallarchaeota archaeon]